MNIYLLTQDENWDWDTYDSFVTIAESEEIARKTHPNPNTKIFWKDNAWRLEDWRDCGEESWASSPNKVTVTLLGLAKEGSIPSNVCSSFNAG